MAESYSWDVRVALAAYDHGGWRAVPPHLLMAVQMIRHGGGCVACSGSSNA